MDSKDVKVEQKNESVKAEGAKKNDVAKREDNSFLNNGFSFFDPLFDTFLPHARAESQLMKTDIKEADNGYELTVDVPGLKKDQIHVAYDDGYLTISAHQDSATSEQDKKGKFIRRERFAGSYERSFYVGDIDQKDIHAKLDNGVLNVSFPKEKEAKESDKFIEIA